ncbi:MAG: bifunctional 2-polyprenyl-6-hydroxyphenol methylase/3-demethylubiquinol 3-O-methyltransferase UbiG [Anaerolineales bacterium]
MSSINNHMYDELADSWWDENGRLHLLKAMVNPWRVPYFADALREGFGPDLSHVRLLDIGCGGGVLTEEFARLGCQVTGIDISTESLAVARAHARTQGLLIDYQAGSAAQLPYNGSSFEVVSCCDVLEHVPEWEQVIVEVGRVLTPNGLFLFDTINRTPQSKVNFIFGLQDFPFTRLFPKDTHVWDMFITPDELSKTLEKHGMQVQGLSGGAIARNPLSTLREVRRHKRGEINVAELGRRLELKLDPDLSLNYLGYAQNLAEVG